MGENLQNWIQFGGGCLYDGEERTICHSRKCLWRTLARSGISWGWREGEEERDRRVVEEDLERMTMAREHLPNIIPDLFMLLKTPTKALGGYFSYTALRNFIPKMGAGNVIEKESVGAGNDSDTSPIDYLTIPYMVLHPLSRSNTHITSKSPSEPLKSTQNTYRTYSISRFSPLTSVKFQPLLFQPLFHCF